MNFDMMLFSLSLLFLVAHRSLSQTIYDPGYINIDCGQDNSYIDSNNITWDSDSRYIDFRCGYNHKTNTAASHVLPLNTLRSFPDMNKNCYTLPVFSGHKYMVRASFNYGNYDLLNKPPSFDLQLDTSKWTTVNTLPDESVGFEMVVMARKRFVSICVSQIKGGGTPFVSSIQMVQLRPGMYRPVLYRRGLLNQYRVYYGGEKSVGYPDDKYSRVWEPAPPSRYANLTADFNSLVSTVLNDPPLPVMKTAIQATATFNSIDLSFNLTESKGPTYIALYFAELLKVNQNDSRTFNIYVNGVDFNRSVSPDYQKCSNIHRYIELAAGPLNVTLAPVKNVSTLPPILSAVEIYTVGEYIANETSTQDISGLSRVMESSDSLERWSGDPCLPVAWQWLKCNQADPPSVTALHLAGLEIKFLDDFSDMWELEIIDLQNNSLTKIPDFLGNFPKLKELNLADNQLSGPIPESLLNNRIALNLSGNPGLTTDTSMTTSNHIALIVGLWASAVSLVIGFIIALFVIRRTRGDTKVGAVELGTVQVGTQAEGEEAEEADDSATSISLEQTDDVIAVAEAEREGTVLN